MKEQEILEKVNLCDEKGDLNKNSIGWARKPIFNLNLKGHPFRKKRWNYWAFINDDCLFSATITDLDYAGMAFIYFYDFKSKDFIEKTITTPFGKDVKMENKVYSDTFFDNKNMKIRMTYENETTTITVDSDDFKSKKFKAKLKVFQPKDYDTLNVVIPWDKKHFQFTSKQEGLECEGYIHIDNKNYDFERNNSFATLDFGRGVWPREISWNWANAGGYSEGKKIGLNLGAKWTDNTGMTENALVINGDLIKISEDVIFSYDKNDLMKPWKLKTKDTDQVNLTFTPVYKRLAKTNFLIIKSDIYQMIGYFSGYIKDKNNKKIKIENLAGCSEEHFAKW
ncbi:MAG: DUF2804 domain-containing protein [Thermotogota bacterium]